MAVKSDIARQVGESIGGVALRYDHVNERASEAVTTSYHDTGAETREGISTIAKGDEGAPLVWSGDNGMPRKSSKVIAIGAGKAVRITRYGYPNWGGIGRDRGTMDTSFGSRSVPWLLFDLTTGAPVLKNGKVLGAQRDDIGSWRGTILIKETLTTFKFFTRETAGGTATSSAWDRYNAQTDKINSSQVNIDVGEWRMNFSAGTLRFDGVAMSARKENFNTVFYNTYSYTYSPFGWQEQYIPPHDNGNGEEPEGYATKPENVMPRSEYRKTDLRVPPGF